MGRFTGFSRMFVLVAGLAVAISGCDKAEDVGRKVMHKSGDLVGKGATEFFSGVGEGVDAVKWKGPDVLTAISTRKSIRKFDASKPVEDDKVEKMLRAAMCAPTAMDKRPWEFIVVKDPAKLSALATRLPYSRVGNGAKLAIVVCGSLDNGLPGRSKEYWIHDCSAATMNLLLCPRPGGCLDGRVSWRRPHCRRPRDSIHTRWLHAAQRHSRRLPGRESASQGQVESGEDSLRQVVTRFPVSVDSP